LTTASIHPSFRSKRFFSFRTAVLSDAGVGNASLNGVVVASVALSTDKHIRCAAAMRAPDIVQVLENTSRSDGVMKAKVSDGASSSNTERQTSSSPKPSM